MLISARRWTGHRLASSIRGHGLSGTPRCAVIRRHRCQDGNLEMIRSRQHCIEAQAVILMQIHHRALTSRRHGGQVAKHGSKCDSCILTRVLRRSEGARPRTGSLCTGPKRSRSNSLCRRGSQGTFFTGFAQLHAKFVSYLLRLCHDRRLNNRLFVGLYQFRTSPVSLIWTRVWTRWSDLDENGLKVFKYKNL